MCNTDGMKSSRITQRVHVAPKSDSGPPNCSSPERFFFPIQSAPFNKRSNITKSDPLNVQFFVFFSLSGRNEVPRVVKLTPYDRAFFVCVLIWSVSGSHRLIYNRILISQAWIRGDPPEVNSYSLTKISNAIKVEKQQLPQSTHSTCLRFTIKFYNNNNKS